MELTEAQAEPKLRGLIWTLLGFLGAGTVHELCAPEEGAAPVVRELRQGEPPAAPAGLGPGELQRIEGVGKLRALRISRALWALGPATGERWLTEIEGVGESTAAKVWPFLVSRGEAHVHSDDASSCPSRLLNPPVPPFPLAPPPPRSPGRAPTAADRVQGPIPERATQASSRSTPPPPR